MLFYDGASPNMWEIPLDWERQTPINPLFGQTSPKTVKHPSLANARKIYVEIVYDKARTATEIQGRRLRD
jgi:hypothetical protein